MRAWSRTRSSWPLTQALCPTSIISQIMEHNEKAAPGPRHCGRGQHIQTWVCMHTTCQCTQHHTKQGHGQPGADLLSSHPSRPDTPWTLMSFPTAKWVRGNPGSMPACHTHCSRPACVSCGCACPLRVRMVEPPWPAARGLRDKLKPLPSPWA